MISLLFQGLYQKWQPKKDVSHPQPLLTLGHVCTAVAAAIPAPFIWTLRRHLQAG